MIVSSFRIAALALGSLAIAAVAAQAHGTSSGLDCGIASQTGHGMTTVAGMVTSPTALLGEYRFSVNSLGQGGSSSINQGGQFSVAPGASVSLGQIMVGAGSNIEVNFTITTGGKTIDCSTPLTTRT